MHVYSDNAQMVSKRGKNTDVRSSLEELLLNIYLSNKTVPFIWKHPNSLHWPMDLYSFNQVVEEMKGNILGIKEKNI